MDMNRYEIVLKVAETGNITRAAEALNYTQSGVSHAVAAVEKEVGVPLFVRSHSGVMLTENGEKILSVLQDLACQLRRYEQTIYSINHVIAGPLRIGTFSSVSAQLLPGILDSFQLQYPQVRIELRDGNYDQIADWIEKGMIDCGFLSRSALRPGFRFAPLLNDPILAVLPPDSPLAAKKEVSILELLSMPLILQAKGCDNDVQVQLKDVLPKADVRYILQDEVSVLSFVSHGYGAALIPKLLMDVLGGDVCILPLSPPLSRELGIASRNAESLTLITKTFIDFVEEKVKS